MTAPIRLADLANHIGAELHAPTAVANTWVHGIAPLKQATPETVSFFANPAYRADLAKTRAAAVIIAPAEQINAPVPTLVIKNPYLGYARTAALFAPAPAVTTGIHPTAVVHPDAIIDPSASIGAHTVIAAKVQIGARVIIGAGCVIQPDVTIATDSHLIARVTLCSGTQIGERVVIHPGAVIGADGFGLANDEGVWVKIPQLGGVTIGNDVEIGANTTIDKGALDNTVIEQGVKLDNQIQIAHNVHIGAHTAIAGCVGIAGSTRIGKYCMIAGGVGIVGHIEIADHVQITGGSVVLQSITEAGTYSSGTPLQTSKLWRRNYHRFKNLDELSQRLKQLEQQKSR